MQITFIEFKEIVQFIYNQNNSQNEYLKSIPNDISEAIFDNKYANLQGNTSEFLMKKIFGDFYEDVNWFLYECNGNIIRHPNTEDKPNITIHGRKYFIHNLESYFEYMIFYYQE